MRVLVTGAAGFIGSHVVRALRARGHDVHAAVRPGSSRARLTDLTGLSVVEVSLEDKSSVDQMTAKIAPEAAVHLAWYADPTDYLVSPSNLASCTATVQLIEVLFSRGCRRLVAAGTCLEYGPSVSLHKESERPAPQGMYATSKHSACVSAVALAEQYGAELAWARIFHVFGPGESPARLVPSVSRALCSGVPIDVTAGAQIRDYLHVSDVAAAFVAILESRLTGAVNVCSGTPVQLLDVLREIGRITGRTDLLRIGARPYAADEVMHLVGCAHRLRSTGWAPRFQSLAEGLEDILATAPRPQA